MAEHTPGERSAPAASPFFLGPTRLGRDVQLAGIRLRVHDWPGKRGPVVCLPGQTASGRSFDGLATALAPAWRVFAVDPRGRGESARPRTGYGYQVLVADVMALLDQFGFEQPVLVGHSYGAIVALLVAAWYPERVGALVLVDGGAEITPAVRAGVDALISRLDTVYPSVDAYLGLLRQAPWLRPWTPELEAFFRASVEEARDGSVRSRTARWAVEQEVRAYWDGPPDYAALYARVRCPTLVIRAEGGFSGADDPVLPSATYQRMLASLPGAQGVEIPGTNHYTVLLGNPEQTIAEVRAFLDAQAR